MESPSAEQQLTAEAQEDSSSVEALLLQCTTTSCNDDDGLLLERSTEQDVDNGSATGFAFFDDLGQLASNDDVASVTLYSERLLQDNDMGSYASRNESTEEFRLEDSLEEVCNEVANQPSTPRRRPTADFQPIGVEVSEEKAQQLKNDVKRLSPVHVSLRERTLGEISLTSSDSRSSASCANGAGEEEADERDDQDKSAESADRSCASRLSSSSSSASDSVGKGHRELVIRLSRVDDERPITSPTSLLDLRNDEDFAAEMSGVDMSAEAKAEEETATATCPFGANLVLERCNAPGFAENRVLSSCGRVTLLDKFEAKSIVEKLHIGDEIEFSSPTSQPQLQQVGFAEMEEGEIEASSEDVLASMAAAAAGVTAATACEDGLTQEIMTRLEQDRPEPFTEDSAESLALAAGVRDEVRSDGSDSGLGSEMPGDPCPAPAPESDSETSFLDRIPDDILSDKDKPASQLDSYAVVELPKTLPLLRAPAKSSLKRRLTDCLEDAEQPDSKRANVEEQVAAGSSSLASSPAGKKKRNIQFDAVTVYYFPRAQGFTCVPSQGGSTLGMSATHTHAERFSLSEHAAEQRRLHRARLAQLRSERAANCTAETASSSEDPSDDTDEEPSDTEELDIDSYYFLQPVPTWQRRALLRAAGVRRIDAMEKDECRDIRASREHCGCGCKGYCDPESCPCSRANVKCQVDRQGFPCGCSRDGCANSSGRIEFNPVRVRTHFIHTLMRLELEKKPAHRDVEEAHQESHHHHHHHQSRLMETAGDCGLAASVSGAGFTGLHYSDGQDGGAHTDSLDLYTIRDDCYVADDCLVVGAEPQQQQRKLHSEFGQGFQHYGPAQGPGISFQQQNPYADYQSYQSMPSTSRSPFQPQFQPVATNTDFSHYGSYSQEPTPGTSSNGCLQTHSLMQQQQQQQHSNIIYDAPFAQDEVTGSQYTNLNSIQPMSSVGQQIGKLEPFSELLSARYSYYGDVVDQQPQNHHQHQQQQPQEQQQQQHHGVYHANGDKMEMEKGDEMVVNEQQEQLTEEDCDENFGEIIKKSMVETVSA